MKTLTSFLMMQAIRSFFLALKTGKATEKIVGIMVAAIVTTFKGMGLLDEIRLLGISVLCHFGGKGVEVPGEIAKLFEFASVSSLQPVQQVSPPVQQTQAGAGSMQPATPAVSKRKQQLAAAGSSPAKPQQPQSEVKMERKVPETTPARVMDTSDGRLDKWIGFLGKFFQGQTINIELTRKLGISVMQSGVVLNRANWETVFGAMKKSLEKRLYLVDKTTCDRVYEEAPEELVTDYLFASDGLLNLVSANLQETPDGREMSPQLVGMCYSLANGLNTLESRLDARFGDGDLDRIDAVIYRIESLNGPAKLLSVLRSEGEGKFIPDTKPAKPPVPAGMGNVRVKGDLNSVVKPSHNGANGIPPAPMMEAGPEMPPPSGDPAEGQPSVH